MPRYGLWTRPDGGVSALHCGNLPDDIRATLQHALAVLAFLAWGERISGAEWQARIRRYMGDGPRSRAICAAIDYAMPDA